MKEDSLKMWNKNSKFFGIGHNDLWSNNLLFSPDRKKVILIDFQGMEGRHMAYDFWYFLYTSTDSKWRADNLDDCFDAYFNILKGYLKDRLYFVLYLMGFFTFRLLLLF